MAKGVFIDPPRDLIEYINKYNRLYFLNIDINTNSVNINRLFEQFGQYDYWIVDHTTIPLDIVSQCINVKDIIFLGTCPRQYLDPDELGQIGIKVHVIKNYGSVSIAEHTMGLILAAARGIPQMDFMLRQGCWNPINGIQLANKTLGIIGYGSIGSEVAKLAKAFGMNILAWNRTYKSIPDVTFTDIDNVLLNSDIISIHLLLNQQTQGIISREKIEKIKPGAIVINTARALLIDTDALVLALNDGRVKCAAFDVFAIEPLPLEDILVKLPNVVLSAHSAYRTVEAMDNLIKNCFEIVKNQIESRIA